MTDQSALSISLAVRDFRRARRSAALERILARLTGKSADLLSFEDVRRKLKTRSSGSRRLQEIPLDAIVGSVGRYSDFTRSFLPRQASDEGRWDAGHLCKREWPRRRGDPEDGSSAREQSDHRGRLWVQPGAGGRDWQFG